MGFLKIERRKGKKIKVQRLREGIILKKEDWRNKKKFKTGVFNLVITCGKKRWKEESISETDWII